MKTRNLLLVLAILLGMFGRASAADLKEQSAARAKRIVPFVNEQTFLVAYIDWTRMPNLSSVLTPLAHAIPAAQKDLQQAGLDFSGFRDAILKTGVKETYLVVNLDAIPPVAKSGGAPFHILIPLDGNVDAEAVGKVFQIPGKPPISRVGDLLHIGPTMTAKPAPRPELATAFEAAGDTAVQLLVVPPPHVRRVLEEASPELPPSLHGGNRILAKGIRWAALGANVAPQPALRLTFQSDDAAAAAALQAWIPKAFAELENRKELHGILGSPTRWAKALTPTVAGDRLLLTLDEKNKEFTSLIGLFAPPVAAAHQAAQRAQSSNNLKQFALAMHTHYDRNRTFPPRASRDKNGKPLLSWRVALLPYLDQKALYDQFHLDEPWDSEHNKKLIAKMPDIYRTPGSDRREPGMTNYVVPVGPDTVFGGDKPLGFKDITDGTVNTIMVVEANDECAVIWTKPDDLPWDPKDPVKGLGGMPRATSTLNNAPMILAALCDGSVRLIHPKLKHIERFFTAKDGQPVNFND